MQTFLPDSNFSKTAKILDKKRLFKQVIEARQILASNGYEVKKNNGDIYKETHKNHPCIKMWKGYEQALINYHNILLEECLVRNIKTKMLPIQVPENIVLPPWIGDQDFHDSHKSNLLRKDPVFYGNYGWNVSPDLPYVWVI